MFEKKSNINNLSSELLTEIFAYLNRKNLNNLGLVSKNWLKVSSDKKLWSPFFPRLTNSQFDGLRKEEIIANKHLALLFKHINPELIQEIKNVANSRGLSEQEAANLMSKASNYFTFNGYYSSLVLAKVFNVSFDSVFGSYDLLISVFQQPKFNPTDYIFRLLSASLLKSLNLMDKFNVPTELRDEVIPLGILKQMMVDLSPNSENLIDQIINRSIGIALTMHTIISAKQLAEDPKLDSSQFEELALRLSSIWALKFSGKSDSLQLQKSLQEADNIHNKFQQYLTKVKDHFLNGSNFTAMDVEVNNNQTTQMMI